MSLLLLDTHAYVWAVAAPQRLSPEAESAIANPSNTILLSAATLWEMAIKHHIGKWPEAGPLLLQHDDVRDRLGVRDLPISARDAIRAGGLTWDHTDPFDRMLAAQALVSQATLVTRDEAFGELLGLTTLW